MKVNFLSLMYRGFGQSKGAADFEGIRLDSQVNLCFRCRMLNVSYRPRSSISEVELILTPAKSSCMDIHLVALWHST